MRARICAVLLFLAFVSLITAIPGVQVRDEGNNNFGTVLSAPNTNPTDTSVVTASTVNVPWPAGTSTAVIIFGISTTYTQSIPSALTFPSGLSSIYPVWTLGSSTTDGWSARSGFTSPLSSSPSSEITTRTATSYGVSSITSTPAEATSTSITSVPSSISAVSATGSSSLSTTTNTVSVSHSSTTGTQSSSTTSSAPSASTSKSGSAKLKVPGLFLFISSLLSSVNGFAPNDIRQLPSQSSFRCPDNTNAICIGGGGATMTIGIGDGSSINTAIPTGLPTPFPCSGNPSVSCVVIKSTTYTISEDTRTAPISPTGMPGPAQSPTSSTVSVSTTGTTQTSSSTSIQITSTASTTSSAPSSLTSPVPSSSTSKSGSAQLKVPTLLFLNSLLARVNAVLAILAALPGV